jgi:hypothetical protein
MASNSEEDGHNGISETNKTEKPKQGHKFTKEELQELHELFAQNPYPDFTTREDLAKKFNFQVYVINNCIQNNSRFHWKRDTEYLLCGNHKIAQSKPMYF